MTALSIGDITDWQEAVRKIWASDPQNGEIPMVFWAPKRIGKTAILCEASKIWGSEKMIYLGYPFTPPDEVPVKLSYYSPLMHYQDFEIELALAEVKKGIVIVDEPHLLPPSWVDWALQRASTSVRVICAGTPNDPTNENAKNASQVGDVLRSHKAKVWLWRNGKLLDWS